MADGRNGGGRPREGTPEYEWLYGGGSGGEGATRPYRQRPGDDESTQVLGGPGTHDADLYPAYPPPPPGRRRARQEPPQGPPHGPPGGRPPGRPGPAGPPPAAPRRRRRFPVLRTVLLLVVLWLVFLVAVPIWAWNNVERIGAMPEGDRPADQPGTTYLVVGSDSRAGLSAEDRARLGTGSVDGDRTDTILMIHTGGGEPVVVSFPRDSFVDLPDGAGSTKINAVYARGGDEGARYLVETVELNTGIRIDHYAEIGMGGVADVVDAVGGIEICPEDPIKDDGAHLDIPGGCQEVDGVTALSYSRARCSKNGPPECPLVRSDLDRVKNQREVVSAVGSKAADPLNVLLPWRYVSLNKAATSFIAVDEDTNVVEAGRMALALRAIGGGARSCTVPIADSSANSWDDARADVLFGAIIADDTSQITDDVCTESGLAP
ncbi:LCP family protein [Nocardioides zeae]|uniref:LCP family protein n=1 Tax=Nocardioides imazamoxiresistens TaxID=3231893 RepID=A0ABU3PV37_9ACTN|nr:LCP family protein [Nocardioides zeae]MDT9592692.1 LCP family protein [Nocardioides zeae]